MSRQHELYLDDIESSIEKIEGYREDFPDEG